VRVLMISKACVVGTYQKKLEELGKFPDTKLAVVVPPYWQEGRRVLPLERAYTSGYEMHVVPMVLNGWFHAHFYRGLRRLVQEFHPDILHIDEEPYNLATFQAMRLAVGYRIKPLFFTWQNLLRRYPPPFSLFERYNLRHAAYAIAGNQEAVAVLRTKGYGGHVQVIPQFGVDPDLYQREQRSPEQGAPLSIGYFGRLVEEKGVQVLLRAAVDLPGNWTLHLFGHGPYQAALQALTRELGIERRVVFQGRVPSTEVPHRLSGLDVLVLPSLTRRNWKEQFGRALVEAMACQVPVVGSSSGEIPNLIGDAGVVFPEGDVQALRDALAILLNDPALRLELGQKGRARVLQHYTQKQIASRTHAIYKDLISTA